MSVQPRICLVSASGQNVFFAEILGAFGDALREHGFALEESIDCFPPPADDLVCLFIPHEYVGLVHELAHPTPAQLQRSVAICTEQPGTEWFETSCAFASRAGAVVDINALGAEEMRRRGVVAEHARLGYIPGWDVWSGRETAERPIDMAFLGRYTDERARVIARCVPALERGRAAIHLTETVRPHIHGSPYFLAGKRRSELLAESKVLLNVHQQELPYLEWHRILSAVLNGCVVLSEHSLQTSPFKPGRHFVSARREDLPLVLEGLLGDPERLEQTRDAAYRLVRDEMPMSAATEVVLDAVRRAHGNPTQKTGPPAPPPVPMPKELAEPKPGWEVYDENARNLLPLRVALKHLVVGMKGLERRLDSLAVGRRAEEDVVERLGPELESPRVSVLLTVHNYADYVGTALRSVALCELPGVEVVAVDDASTDESVEAIREACAEHPWLPVTLVRCAVNRGLPAARNLAMEHARAELLFILDADNAVLPHGPGKLVEALDEHPEAAFAYGVIEKFDMNGPLEVVNWHHWEPERLRYGNFVDAMALIRRSALEAVGGYSTEAAFAGGWEDFALWVAMADAGMSGVRVPDFVARYRVSPHSMLSLSNIDATAVWGALLRKHPTLWRGEVVGEPA